MLKNGNNTTIYHKHGKDGPPPTKLTRNPAAKIGQNANGCSTGCHQMAKGIFGHTNLNYELRIINYKLSFISIIHGS